MKFKCDLYCYATDGGNSVVFCYQTHVASNRIVEDLPPSPFDLFPSLESGCITYEDYNKSIKEYYNALEKVTRKPIGLEYDGQSFLDCDLQSFRKRLENLREAGYNFPDYVFDRIDEEIQEEAEEC